MTIYEKFEELISTHNILILDNPEWCKAFFRKAGFFEYISDFIDYRDFSNLRDAVEEMVRYFSAKILSDYIRIKAYLRDISRNMIEEFDIKSFIVFLTALNAENVVFSFTNKRNIYFLSLLDSALEKTENTYVPLERQKQYLQEQKEFRKIV